MFEEKKLKFKQSIGQRVTVGFDGVDVCIYPENAISENQVIYLTFNSMKKLILWENDLRTAIIETCSTLENCKLPAYCPREE